MAALGYPGYATRRYAWTPNPSSIENTPMHATSGMELAVFGSCVLASVEGAAGGVAGAGFTVGAGVVTAGADVVFCTSR